MPNEGKRLRGQRVKVDATRRYAMDEAVGLIKEMASAKFDESVDVAVRLGVDPRHADQMVRGAVSLPHGTGKSVRVIVFADGEAARAAEEAGAEAVGSDELVQKVNDGWFEFDKAVAATNMMGKVGRLGRVLGPRGLMPNPTVGTVVAPDQIGETIRELKRGKIDFRVEKAGIVHCSIGRASMSQEALRDNFAALMGTLMRLKPSSAKGSYVKSVAISTTMGPGVRIDVLDAQRAGEG